ncbi:MAG TPA: GNAT family N-acetyltransferase, partial [Croceibacterium sp.]
MLQVPPDVFKVTHTPVRMVLRLLRADALEAHDRLQWDKLGGDAAAPSVFAEPWLMRCSLAHCDAQGAARLAVVEDESGRWLGVLPVVATRRQGRSPVPAWAAWRHPNQFVGAPLVRRGYADDFWRRLVEGLGAHGQRVSLVLGKLPSDDPVTDALFRLCAAQRRGVIVDRRIARAFLDADAAPAQCARQRSRLRGLERKLAGEVGPVAFAVARDAGQIDAFLALEQSGWKGRAGSALACADRTQAFFREVCAEAAARDRLEVATLSAGGQVIAVSIQLEGAGLRYGFKAAYDETFARCAPGLLLLDRLTQHYVVRGGVGVDSCTVPEQQPVSRLWPGRRELVDCRVALGGATRGRLFAAMLACERA